MTRRGRLGDELRRLGNTPVAVFEPMRAQRLKRRVSAGPAPRARIGRCRIGRFSRTSRRRSAIVTLVAACCSPSW